MVIGFRHTKLYCSSCICYTRQLVALCCMKGMLGTTHIISWQTAQWGCITWFQTLVLQYALHCSACTYMLHQTAALHEGCAHIIWQTAQQGCITTWFQTPVLQYALQKEVACTFVRQEDYSNFVRLPPAACIHLHLQLKSDTYMPRLR